MKRHVPLLILIALAAGVPLAPACMVAPRHGDRVDTASETAVVVWDEAAKTEHFIRKASFVGASADFGFVVPTPSIPELAEATDAGFAALAAATAPRVVYETRTIEEPAFGCSSYPAGKNDTFGGVASAVPPGPPVAVVKTQKVGAFDAVVLKADDPQKLRDWMTANGYAARPEAVAWLKAYTDAKWYVTAFKIGVADAAAGAAAKTTTGTTVRMSFKTDAPFYPYREPEDARAGGGGGGGAPNRLLRVYFLADKRFAGTVGKAGAWPGRTVWAGPTVGDAVGTAAGLNLSDKSWILTEFEDTSSPRPGTDEVYFAPSADPAGVERPPVVHVIYEKVQNNRRIFLAVAACGGLLAIVGIFVAFRVVRRLGRPRAD